MCPPETNNETPGSGEQPSGVVPPETRQQMRHDLDTVKKTAAHDVDSVKQRAVEDVQNLKHKAEDELDAAREKAKSFAGAQKDLAAGQLDGVAAAINKVASELDQTDQAVISRYARDLAGGIAHISGTVRDHDADELMGMAQEFGRKQPIAFLGAAALAGFVASRFALASAHRRDSTPSAGRSASGQPSATRPDTGLSSGKEGDHV